MGSGIRWPCHCRRCSHRHGRPSCCQLRQRFPICLSHHPGSCPCCHPCCRRSLCWCWTLCCQLCWSRPRCLDIVLDNFVLLGFEKKESAKKKKNSPKKKKKKKKKK